jgi:hypothetical protein
VRGLTGNRWWLVLAAAWILIAGLYFYRWRRPSQGKTTQVTGDDRSEN